MPDQSTILVEVAYAEPSRQEIVQVQVPSNATVADAIALSAIQQLFPNVDMDQAPVGIFSRKCERDTPLKAGDRVEIYRPLKADPKEIRRLRAAGLLKSKASDQED